MDIGILLPSAGPHATARGILDVARAAERLGFASVWMFDHLFTPLALASRYPYGKNGAYPVSPEHPFFDPLGIIGVLAGATERVRICTGVMVAAYRHPIVLAKALATIDQLSPGRIGLGVGAGWMDEEFRALGIDTEKKGARLEEHVRAMRAVWSGVPTAFEGERYAWPESSFLPAPAGRIPIIIGGHADVSLRRAARVGDGWAIVTASGQGSGLEAVAERLGLLATMRQEEGRAGEPFELVYQNPVVFSPDPLPRLPLSGPRDAILEGLARLRALGVTTVVLTIHGASGAMVDVAQRFAEEILPAIGG
jgi:probable F420-dependent oxidoreductase